MSEQNISAALCIKEKTHWGYDTMVNFCTGKSYNVDWVFSDYLAVSFCLVFFAIVFIGIIFLVWDANR